MRSATTLKARLLHIICMGYEDLLAQLRHDEGGEGSFIPDGALLGVHGELAVELAEIVEAELAAIGVGSDGVELHLRTAEIPLVRSGLADWRA